MSAVPGDLPPLKAITDTDHGAVVAITAAVGLSFAIISVLIRVYVRIECRASFGKDDFTSFASMSVAIIQAAVVFVAVSAGFGVAAEKLSSAAMAAWQRDLYISDVFFLLTMCLTKISTALLLMRLSRDTTHGLMAKILLGASAVYFVVSLFVVTIRCDTHNPWIQSPQCADTTFSRWIAVTVLDVITEVALFLGGLNLVRNVQLPWSKKIVVVIAYGLRLLVISASVVRLYYIHVSLFSTDPSLDGVLASVCTQVELAYAVISTTTPCLKPFMSGLTTNYGGVADFVMNQSPTSTALQRTQRSKATANATKDETVVSQNSATSGTFGLTSTVRGGGPNAPLANNSHSARPPPRPSTESASHILDGASEKSQDTGMTSGPRATTAEAEQTNNSRRLSGVAVTYDITVSEEKEDQQPPHPSSPSMSGHGMGGGRGHHY